MKRHVDFDELQDFQEELLTPERGAEIRRHLELCQDCRDDLAALRGLLGDLGDLPEEAEPSRDLWPQIEWRMGRAGTPEVQETGRPGITLPLWQLAAASIVVALLSGGAVWTFISGTPQGVPPTPGISASMAQPAGLDAGFEEYEAAAVELEAILDEGRAVLDPETIRIVEESLAVIDEAIEESKEALAQDPASGLLRRILTDTMRRKVDFLRQAAVAIYANT